MIHSNYETWEITLHKFKKKKVLLATVLKTWFNNLKSLQLLNSSLIGGLVILKKKKKHKSALIFLIWSEAIAIKQHNFNCNIKFMLCMGAGFFSYDGEVKSKRFISAKCSWNHSKQMFLTSNLRKVRVVVKGFNVKFAHYVTGWTWLDLTILKNKKK